MGTKIAESIPQGPRQNPEPQGDFRNPGPRLLPKPGTTRFFVTLISHGIVGAHRRRPVPTVKPKPLEATISVQLSAALKAKVEEAAGSEGIAQQQLVRQAIFRYLDDVHSSRSAWETLDPDEHYDPDRFYVAGRDQQGHYSEIRVQIPTQLAGEIARLVEDRRIPFYMTRQHVARDAIYHRVKVLSKMLDDGKLEEAVNMAMLESDEIMEASRAEDARRLLASMEANLKALLERAEANGRFERIIAYLEDRADKAQVIDEEWRDEYEGVLREYKKEVRRLTRRASVR